MEAPMRQLRCRKWVVAITLVLLASACAGKIFEPTAREDGSNPWGAPRREPTADECETLAPSVGTTPLRRLTQEQYRNTVRDALGMEMPEEASRRLLDIPDGREGGFASSADAPGTEPMQGYVAIAEVLAET